MTGMSNAQWMDECSWLCHACCSQSFWHVLGESVVAPMSDQLLIQLIWNHAVVDPDSANAPKTTHLKQSSLMALVTVQQ